MLAIILKVENKKGAYAMKKKYIDLTLQYIREDLPDYKVEDSIVNKNNGVQLNSITIRGNNSDISPVFYLNKFYQEGYTEKECAIAIVQQFNEFRKEEFPFDINQITDFEAVKDKICYKIVNKEANKDILQDIPYGDISNDLACVYYIDLKNQASITIHDVLLDEWGILEDDLYELADKNTQRIYSKVEFKPLNSVIVDIMEDSGNLQEMKIQFGVPNIDDKAFKEMIVDMIDSESSVPMYVLRGADNNFGASVLLYDNILSSVKKELGTDYVVFPASVHELLVMPWSDKYSIAELREIVHQVNEQEVSKEEQLSDNVYFCNGKEIVVLTDEVIAKGKNQAVAEAR